MIEILIVVGVYLFFDMCLDGPATRIGESTASLISRGGGSLKKEKFLEKELELESRKVAIAEKVADNTARALAIREKRLELIGKALDLDAPSDILATLDKEDDGHVVEPIPRKDRV